MTEREKIVQVLTHAVQQGEKSKYFGVRFYRIHNSTVVEFKKELKKELKIKKELFTRVDEKSNTYKIILEKAKVSLEKLKNGDFENSSAELINLFLSLQSAFNNKLEFIECKEFYGKKPVIEQKEETPEEKTKRLKVVKRKIREIKYLPEGLTSQKKRKIQEKQQETDELFSSAESLDF